MPAHPPHDLEDQDYLCIPKVLQEHDSPLDSFIAILGQQKLHIMKILETRRLLVDPTACKPTLPDTQTLWHEVQIQAQLAMECVMAELPQDQPGYIRNNWQLKLLREFCWNPRRNTWNGCT